VKVWLDGTGSVELTGLSMLGHGGEADVYDLGDRALKLYKSPKHPDVAGDPAREAAAAARLATAEERLTAFPRNLPARVAVPRALVRTSKRGPVAGYVMDKVPGRPLYELGEPRVRRGGAIDLDALVGALRDLHATVGALHAAGVVIGDFNDGNVLVDLSSGASRAALIDADSFAWGAWPCAMFTERFVDPRLCDAAAPAPALVRPHDARSDWFAYAVMLFRTLCWVGPFGGVYQPADPARRVLAAARPLRGPSVLQPDVVYPRSAAPLAALSDELLDHFTAVFDRGARGVFPPALLDRLRLRRCGDCGLDHARARCPACARQVAVPATWGELTLVPVDPATVPSAAARELDGIARDALGALWLAAGQVW
jgi:DNA-binding helix-hairpin-helix protein with protein kinase domain